MKNKIVIDGKNMQIVLSDGREFSNDDNLEREAFITSTADYIMEDLSEISEVTSEKLKSASTAQLQKKLTSAGSLEMELIEVLLKTRGVEPAAEEKASKPKKEKKEKVKKEKVKKEPKEKLPPLTDEEKAEYAKNKNREITFIPHSGSVDEEGNPVAVTGIINGLMHDKRVNKTYYRIYVGTGSERKMYHKEVRSESYSLGEFIEIPEEPTKEEPTKEEPTKEEPTKEEPTKEEPTKEEPTKED